MLIPEVKGVLKILHNVIKFL